MLSNLRSSLRAHWPIIAITLLSGFIRLWGVGNVGFNSDEAVYVGQAAALAGDSAKAQFFSVFRAHPLLVQFLVSLTYRFQASEFAARAVTATLGTLTVSCVYVLGSMMYSRKLAIISSLFLALLPYHILVSRQVLLDVGLGFFFPLTMLFLYKFVKSGGFLWVYAAGASAALAILSKEPGVLLIPIGFIYLMTQNMVSFRALKYAFSGFLLAISPYPLSLALGGGVGKTASVAVWQISRTANHTWLFYPVSLFPYFDIAAILAVLGIVVALLRRTPSDILLLLWFGLTSVFFQLWPVKGFHYLMPVAPVICMLAGRFFDIRFPHLRMFSLPVPSVRRLVSLLLIFLAVSSLIYAYIFGAVAVQQAAPLAGLSGLYGGREAGAWIRLNVPEGATFLSIGPTMTNLIEFYGERPAFALSVSPNPIRRNPSYTPVVNPDFLIRTGQIQYIAWDIYSAMRSQHFSDRLMGYVSRYGGVLVFSLYSQITTSSGNASQTLIIAIYRVYGTVAA